MSNLTDIVLRALELSNVIASHGGELTPEIEQALDLNEQNFSEKIDGYIALIKQLEQTASVFDTYAKQMKDRQKGIDNRVEWLRSKLKSAHQALDLKAIDGNVFKSLVVEMKPKLVIDSDRVPEKYLKIVQKFEVDKEAISDAILNGETIDFARFEAVHALRLTETTQVKRIK